MFKKLWDHPHLWCKPDYLVLLAHMVYETENPSLIQTFLTSEKTKILFQSISLAERQKFIIFTTDSLEDMFDETKSSEGGPNSIYALY